MPTVNDRFPKNGHFSAKSWDEPGDLNLQIAYVAYDESIGFDKTGDVIHFLNDARTLPLNDTNAHAIGKIHGKEMDAWPSKWIALYLDPDVEYKGQKTGGIRVREVAAGNGNGTAVAVTPPPRQPPKPDFDDEILF